MTRPLDRVRQLMALAGGPTTPPEEARSAAMLALRIIAREELLEGSPRSGNAFAGAVPTHHCVGCRCFSNEDFGRYKPRPEPQRAPWDDPFREPESEEQRRYREGWERIWGGAAR